MKALILLANLLLLISSLKIHGAPPSLRLQIPPIKLNFYKNFCKNPKTKELSRECSIMKRYQDLKFSLGKKNLVIENIAWYRALRFVDYKNLENLFMQPRVPKKFPWKIYDPQPKTWIYWEKGNFFRRELSDAISRKSQWTLTLEELQNLHMRLLDVELQKLGGNTSKAKATRTAQTIAGALGVVPPPGVLRNPSYTPSFTVKNIPNEKFSIFKQIESELPTMSIKINLNKKNKTFNASFTFTKGGKPVLEAIQVFLAELNSGMQAILKGQTNETPMHFAARMQRNYVSIHPFHEGNGRMSRMIQDLILESFTLPFAPSGYLQDDLVVPLTVYYEQNLKRTEEVLDVLTHCNREIKKGSLGAKCYPLYRGTREISLQQANLENQDIYSLIQKEILIDLVERGNPFDPIEDKYSQLFPINDAKNLCTKAKPMCYEYFYTQGIEGNDFKRKLIEKAAALTPLTAPLQLYTWVAGKNHLLRSQFDIARKNPTRYYSWFIGKTSEIKPNARMGKGIYGAIDPFSSAIFSLGKKEQEKQAKDNHAYNAALLKIKNDTSLSTNEKYEAIKSLEERKKYFATYTEANSLDAILYVTKIATGQPFLDMTDKHIIKTLNNLGIKTSLNPLLNNNSNNDIGHLNPKILVKYVTSGWYINKLMTKGSYSIKQAEPQDIPASIASEYRERLNQNRLRGGQAYLKGLIEGKNFYIEEQAALAQTSAGRGNQAHEAVNTGVGSATLTFQRYELLTRDCRCESTCKNRGPIKGYYCRVPKPCGLEEFKAKKLKIINSNLYRKCQTEFEKRIQEKRR